MIRMGGEERGRKQIRNVFYNLLAFYSSRANYSFLVLQKSTRYTKKKKIKKME